MKKLNLMAFMAVFALVFTSCSKDNDEMANPDTERATLTFGAIVNDLVTNQANRQSTGDIPQCSNDAPAFVEVVLSQGGANVVGSNEDPLRVNLVAGQVFTEEISDLELVPGNYSLDHFTVFNADGDLLWVAPKAGSDLAGFVANALPLNIDLRAGVKKYVDVSVLCFDNRDVNEYGYAFFNLDTNQGIKFCIFGNYCPPSGRHFPASYSVSVWSGTNTSGTPLYTDEQNQTGYYDNGDYYAEPLCFALPDRDGQDNYYFEITLRSSDEYGDVTEEVIRRGTITDDIVRSFFDGDDNLEYYHFREGCDGDDDVPIFEDPRSDEEYYATCAYPMNGSNSIALAYFRKQGDVLKTTVIAAGMTPNKMHPQHIHGFEDGRESVCPPASADSNGDGFISIEEGAPFYGGVLLSLNYEDGSFPVAKGNGIYEYERTFDVSGMNLPHLEKLTVVAHGRMVGNEYVATLPVACGQVNNLNGMHQQH